jgi:hypothetical protein
MIPRTRFLPSSIRLTPPDGIPFPGVFSRETPMGCAAAVMRAQIRETDIRLFFAYTVNPGFRPVNRRHIEKHEAPGVRDIISEPGRDRQYQRSAGDRSIQ